MDNQVFFYVDGIPTKGLWIDMGLIDSWDEIKAELVAGGAAPRTTTATFWQPMPRVCAHRS